MSNRVSASLKVLGVIATAMALAATSASARPARSDLRIISIDVEGGASTLYITPQGHTFLIDAGWPAGLGGSPAAPGAPPSPAPTPSMAQRVAATLKHEGLTKLDYVLISHYHVDHVGALVELSGLVPIGTFIDHGPNREEPRAGATPAQLANATATLYPKYLTAVGDKPHIVMKPGQVLKIDDLVLTAVNADGQVIDHSLSPSSGPGADCASATSKDGNGGEENVRSVGLVIQWGKARILSLADTTWNVENRLVCPQNLIGTVDLMFVDNHGTEISNSPNLLQSVKPTVVIANNGPVKGADGTVLARYEALPSVKGLWQLHFATRSPADNTAPDQIANLLGEDKVYPLRISVAKSGTVTLTNPRNGYSKTYPQKP